MGLPNMNILFIGSGQSAIARSARGIVAMILKDTNAGDTPSLMEYTSLSQVDFTGITAENYDYFKLVFEGAPHKVMAVMIKPDATYDQALKILSNYKWNYLTAPAITAEETTLITGWIKEQRDQNKKTFKAVLANAKADHEGIINCTTDQINTGITGKVHTTAQYCPRIAGILAGLSLDRSCTYYDLSDIVNASTPDDPDKRIDAGELIIVYDGTDYKIGRGVNSLTTYTSEKTKDLSKIKIMEGKDMISDDLTSTFADNYVGKYINNYDNKQMLVAAINSYFKELAGNVLDPDYDNNAQVDADAQVKYLESNGIDTSQLSDQDKLVANTGSVVLLSAAVKFVDAMEDLTFEIAM